MTEVSSLKSLVSNLWVALYETRVESFKSLSSQSLKKTRDFNYPR